MCLQRQRRQPDSAVETHRFNDLQFTIHNPTTITTIEFTKIKMNTHTHTISFQPDGTALCLWTEALPLHELGRVEITRATTIEFHNGQQLWEVRDPQGVLLYSAPSRNACLTWEHDHLQ